MTTIHTGNKQLHLWIMGDNSLGIVNCESMTHDLIPNFFGEFEGIIPLTVITNLIADKVLGLYICQKGDIYFVFFRRSSGIIRKTQSEVLSQGKFDII